MSMNTVYANDGTSGEHENISSIRGRGCMSQGSRRGKGSSSFINRPTCQLYGKYGHVLIDCWHRFYDYFSLTQPHDKNSNISSLPTENNDASTSDPQALVMMSTTDEYSWLRRS